MTTVSAPSRMNDDRPLEFDAYPRQHDIETLLYRWSDEYPDLVLIESLGISAEGRTLWSATVTDFAQGDPSAKPAVYLEGNIHAGEVLPSAVCLTTIHDLLSRAKSDTQIGELLARRTFYIRPRVAPDGAERYLTTPDRLRSATIPWPTAQRQPGLHPADVNGDGHITLMRFRHPLGEWRISRHDPRVMVRCQPDDDEMDRYRLLQEGFIEGDVSPNPATAPAFWGLDFNRGFPHNWRPEHQQPGAGPYPLSSAEIRATADFFLSHPNICAAILYHTSGGFVYRLPSSAPKSSYPHNDLRGDYRQLTDVFTRITGQPAFPSFDETTNTARCGSLMDWTYSQQGVLSWVPELWDIQLEAGVREERAHPFQILTETEEVALLAWADTQLAGEIFRPWVPFNHSDLGEVEIGGWTYKFTHQNCPPDRIARVARPVMDWSYVVARSLPELTWERTATEQLDERTWVVTGTVTNGGFLPTNVCHQALAAGKADPVRVSIHVTDAQIISGSPELDLGHLEGASGAGEPPWRDPNAGRRSAEVRCVITVIGPNPSVELTAACPRAGRATTSLNLQ